MMDPEIKAKWIVALRSGKYEQTQKSLRTGNAFCCLGVLCDLVKPKAWLGSDDDPFYYHVGQATSFPDDSVLEAAGTSREDGDGGHPFWQLAHMNDDGKSFAEIADYIEKSL